MATFFHGESDAIFFLQKNGLGNTMVDFFRKLFPETRVKNSTK
jgi:hypothetical protein